MRERPLPEDGGGHPETGYRGPVAVKTMARREAMTPRGFGGRARQIAPTPRLMGLPSMLPTMPRMMPAPSAPRRLSYQAAVASGS